MSTTLAQLELTAITCGECGVTFAVPAALHRRLVNNHGDFWCPNGHQRHFIGKTDAERLREQLDQAKARERHQADQREAAELSNRALRGVITKQRKRAAAGVCPCCGRTFKALADHMASQHPGYATADVTA